MGIVSVLLAALIMGALPAEVVTLNGERHTGTLERLSADSITLSQPGGKKVIPAVDLLEVDLVDPPAAKAPVPPTAAGAPATTPAPAAAPTPAVGTPPAAGSAGMVSPAEVELLDGSRFHSREITVSGANVTLVSAGLGKRVVPLDAIASIRFAPLDDKVAPAWKDLTSRNSRQDMLVVRKGDILDHLEGLLGEIDDKRVRFTLDGNEIPVARAKAYGIIYSRRKLENLKPACEISLRGGEKLLVRAVTATDTTFEAELVSGTKLSAPLASVKTFGFGVGKLQYLSRLEPREEKHTPYWDIPYKVGRDRYLYGGPLELGGKSYTRGLCIHSRTLLTYRIAGDYRRFRAIVGIDQRVASKGIGDVDLKISGDGKVLFQGKVRGVDSPKALDLDVGGVRDLEILVDFGGDLDIADHLNLADAMLVK